MVTGVNYVKPMRVCSKLFLDSSILILPKLLNSSSERLYRTIMRTIKERRNSNWLLSLVTQKWSSTTNSISSWGQRNSPKKTSNKDYKSPWDNSGSRMRNSRGKSLLSTPPTRRWRERCRTPSLRRITPLMTNTKPSRSITKLSQRKSWVLELSSKHNWRISSRRTGVRWKSWRMSSRLSWVILRERIRIWSWLCRMFRWSLVSLRSYSRVITKLC